MILLRHLTIIILILFAFHLIYLINLLVSVKQQLMATTFLLITRSATFVKTVWRFSHIDGSQIKKTAISYKKIIFSSFSREILKIQASNFTQMLIGPLSTTYVKTVWRFFDLTAVNMRKKCFKHLFCLRLCLSLCLCLFDLRTGGPAKFPCFFCFFSFSFA